jgi:hypothetical protein
MIFIAGLVLIIAGWAARVYKTVGRETVTTHGRTEQISHTPGSVLTLDTKVCIIPSYSNDSGNFADGIGQIKQFLARFVPL